MGDDNTIHLGDNAQAKQVAQGQNISQTIIENYIERARLLDARFSIPAPPRDFTGRADEIETLVNALTQGKGSDVTIAAITGVSGMGGIGKSALAMVVAQRVADHFPDARMWVALNGTDAQPKTPPDAMREIIFAFDPDTGIALKDASNEQIAQVYRAVLQNLRALLVLDNARDNAQIRPLLQANAAFLITARANLTEGGLHPLHLGVMNADEAEAYLVSLCPRLESSSAVCRPLSELCGYLPLALKIAGSYLAERQNVRAENYLARLKQARLDLLREGREAETNVEAAFQQTYVQLSLSQQMLFNALSVFPAPFTLQAAAYVWGLEEIPAEAALGELVRASFVEYEAPAERTLSEHEHSEAAKRQSKQGRYFLHDLLREFGERRTTEDERRTSHLRHAEYYVQVARAADELYLKGNENILAGLKLFDDELPHIRAGQAWASSRALSRAAAANVENDDDAARLCSDYPDAAEYVSEFRLPVREQIRWLEQAVIAARKLGNRKSEAYRLGNLGNAYAALGDVRKAIEYHEQALTVIREIGDRGGEGNMLGNLGVAYLALGDVRKAIEFYEQTLVIHREIGDRRGEGKTLGNLGNAYADLGDVRQAIEFYEQRIVIAREMGDRHGEGDNLGNLGNAYAALGDVRRAIMFYEQILVIYREIGYKRGEGAALGNLGNAYLALGDVRRAIEFYEQHLVITREVGDRRGEGADLANLGLAYKKLGDMDRAKELWRGALEIYEAIEDPNAERVRGWLEENEQ